MNTNAKMEPNECVLHTQQYVLTTTSVHGRALDHGLQIKEVSYENK